MAEKGALRGGALRTAQRRATQRREVEGRLGRAEKRVLRGAGGLRGGARALSATPPDAPSAPVPGGLIPSAPGDPEGARGGHPPALTSDAAPAPARPAPTRSAVARLPDEDDPGGRRPGVPPAAGSASSRAPGRSRALPRLSPRKPADATHPGGAVAPPCVAGTTAARGRRKQPKGARRTPRPPEAPRAAGKSRRRSGALVRGRGPRSPGGSPWAGSPAVLPGTLSRSPPLSRPHNAGSERGGWRSGLTRCARRRKPATFLRVTFLAASPGGENVGERRSRADSCRGFPGRRPSAGPCFSHLREAGWWFERISEKSQWVRRHT